MESKVKVTVTMSQKVLEKLNESAERMGINRSAYVSYLIMQKEQEKSAIDFVAKLTPEQIQKAIKENGIQGAQGDE